MQKRWHIDHISSAVTIPVSCKICAETLVSSLEIFNILFSIFIDSSLLKRVHLSYQMCELIREEDEFRDKMLSVR